MRNGWKLTFLLGALALGACSVETKDGDTAAAGATTTATAADSAAISPMAGASVGATTGAAAGDSAQMRIEVDVKARRLHVLRGGQRTDSFRVAVGSEKWPTQTGQWTITQVVFNPEWVPPDESWAEEREPRKPGDPKNPLGRAQLVYDPPRSIHGTNAPESIGKAVSHGSIRMTNEDIVRLAREVMEAAGSGRDDSFHSRMRANRTEKQIVQLARPVPIRVY